MVIEKASGSSISEPLQILFVSPSGHFMDKLASIITEAYVKECVGNRVGGSITKTRHVLVRTEITYRAIGEALAGSAFDVIAVIYPSGRLMRTEEMDWIQYIHCRLKPGGKFIALN